MVIPTLVKQALANQPMTVFGDGKQSRCFTHVADVVRALAGLMESGTSYGEVFNIGNTVEISINDLAGKIREACSSTSQIVHIPYEKAYEEGFEDMPRRIPNTAKIKGAIGWQPTIDLSKILSDVIESFRKPR